MDNLYATRPYARFWVLETIARVPYFACAGPLTQPPAGRPPALRSRGAQRRGYSLHYNPLMLVAPPRPRARRPRRLLSATKRQPPPLPTPHTPACVQLHQRAAPL